MNLRKFIVSYERTVGMFSRETEIVWATDADAAVHIFIHALQPNSKIMRSSITAKEFVD